MSEGTEAGAVLYYEPSIITILIQSSFIIALNAIDYVLDKAIYCGLIGQILIGMAWGTPGAGILGDDFQRIITELGYLGLILIVFEGGLSTDMKALRSNLVLSTLVALTGITLPIGLSFILIKMCGATTLQSFAAGCALSSTSLGTTFAILKSNGLDNSTLGMVLTSAAMLDDVVGLVLVQVISNLGASKEGNFSAAIIIRPVFVSIGYAAVVPILLSLFNRLGPKVHGISWTPGKVAAVLAPHQARFVYYTVVLIVAVTSASYAGTSNLFVAYLAGLLISSGGHARRCWHKLKIAPKADTAGESLTREADPFKSSAIDSTNESWEMVAANADTVEQVDAITEPMDPNPGPEQPESHKPSEIIRANTTDIATQTVPVSNSDDEVNIYQTYYSTIVNRLLKGFFFGSIGLSIPITKLFDPPTLWRGIIFSLLMTLGKLACGLWLVRLSPPTSPSTQSTTKAKKVWTNLLHYRPQSLYPAAMLGSAMVARGEIGFLISAIARSNGIFDKSGDSQWQQGDLFLIVTWAILICTMVGPVSVGLLTRRVKRLRREAGGEGDRRVDPLGVWADL